MDAHRSPDTTPFPRVARLFVVLVHCQSAANENPALVTSSRGRACVCVTVYTIVRSRTPARQHACSTVCVILSPPSPTHSFYFLTPTFSPAFLPILPALFLAVVYFMILAPMVSLGSHIFSLPLSTRISFLAREFPPRRFFLSSLRLSRFHRLGRLSRKKGPWIPHDDMKSSCT